jgi:hypothetical protein
MSPAICRPALEAVLRRLLPRSSSSSSSSSGGGGGPAPQLLLLTSPAGAAAAQRFCATLPQLGRLVAAVADLRSAHEAAAEQQSQAPHHQDSQQDVSDSGHQLVQQQQVGTSHPPPPAALVLPQHLLLTQLAVSVRRHLVGRRAARVVVECASASEAQLGARLFRLLLKLPTLELHSRKTLSYRRWVG